MKVLALAVALVFAVSLFAGCSSTCSTSYSSHGPEKVQVKSNPSGTMIKVHEGHGENMHVKVKDNPSGTSIKVR